MSLFLQPAATHTGFNIQLCFIIPSGGGEEFLQSVFILKEGRSGNRRGRIREQRAPRPGPGSEPHNSSGGEFKPVSRHKTQLNPQTRFSGRSEEPKSLDFFCYMWKQKKSVIFPGIFRKNSGTTSPPLKNYFFKEFCQKTFPHSPLVANQIAFVFMFQVFRYIKGTVPKKNPKSRCSSSL